MFYGVFSCIWNEKTPINLGFIRKIILFRILLKVEFHQVNLIVIVEFEIEYEQITYLLKRQSILKIDLLKLRDE